MNKKDIMYKFIKIIEREKKLTNFIKNLFDYQNFHDYNYIFRIIASESEVILDIYDNISVNRFNRYIFNFSEGNFVIKTQEENNVFITYINVENVENPQNKLLKLAYIFKTLSPNEIADAKDFLDKEYIIILNKLIK